MHGNSRTLAKRGVAFLTGRLAVSRNLVSGVAVYGGGVSDIRSGTVLQMNCLHDLDANVWRLHVRLNW